jgi:ATP-dependent DNA helicase DinG
MHSVEELAAAGLAAFDSVVTGADGFRARPGQREMAQAVARAFAAATLGETQEVPDRAIAVVQAGTGVGKSAAYNAVGIAIAKMRKTRLVISTASVALQEQLVNKDLPLLARHMSEPFTFALAKGRGRYACKLKLVQRALVDANSADLLDVEDDAPHEPVRPSEEASARVQFYRRLVDALETGWNGDRDALPDPPAPADWAGIAAERHTCTVRACPHFGSCAYYQARRELAKADVIVANHDLVLASIGARTLPELDSALLAFDEAHHLPAKAVAQFASHMDLTRLRWLDKLPRALAVVASEVGHALTFPPELIARELKSALSDLGRLLWDQYSSGMRDSDGYRRLGEQDVHGALQEPLDAIRARAVLLDDATGAIGQALREAMKEQPANNARWSTLFAVLGGFAPRVTAVRHTTDLLLAEGEEARQLAKWSSVDRAGTAIALQLHACPILPGQLLALHLWHRVRGCVLTSATLTSCGSFDYFLNEAGLAADPAVQAIEVASPFDYRRQGALVVRKTKAAPRDTRPFSDEATRLLIEDLHRVTTGALVLFTSRRHMQQACEALPVDLKPIVLVQGVEPRAALLARHRDRVAAGLPSIIFGLQQFGEGLDLPGALCDRLFIMKLPFQPPADPVGQARAEYVEAEGGNAFADLVVPATGVRLMQWTGRGIRTESDRAVITCFDRRLTESSFGRQILKGLPPYPVEVVPARSLDQPSCGAG